MTEKSLDCIGIDTTTQNVGKSDFQPKPPMVRAVEEYMQGLGVAFVDCKPNDDG
jgi:hypothetical protein